MNPLQIIWSFFTEIVNRIRTKSPAFFKVLQVIGASLTFAGYIPSMMQQWFGVHVHWQTIKFCETVAHYATGFWASSALAAKTSVVAQTEKGIEIRVTDQKKMPFSAKAEAKEIDKMKPPPPTVENEKVDLSSMSTAAPNDDSLKH